MLILGTHKISAFKYQEIAFLALATFAFSAELSIASPQTADIPPSSVTVQSGDALSAPPAQPSISSQLSQQGAQDRPSKASELFAPVTKANTPKNFVKSAPSGPVEMDLRQLWNELKLNNPQLASLRESYLSAKATVPQIAAPANPQVGLVWSGMPANSPFALGGANAPTPQYPNGISRITRSLLRSPFSSLVRRA